MKRTNSKSGYILLTVAVLLVLLLLGFTALAVDVGVLYGARTQGQGAADAAALAGAFTFILNPLAPQPATAQTQATQAAISNNVFSCGGVTPISGATGFSVPLRLVHLP